MPLIDSRGSSWLIRVRMPSATDSPPLSVEATQTYKQRVEESAAFLQEKLSFLPSTALLLEPEIGEFDEGITIREEWPFSALPHFPERDDPDRSGRLLVCTIGSATVFLVEGALSLQEGFTPWEVVFPVRLLGESAVNRLVVANTATSVSPAIPWGALVLIQDHINFQGANPLVGPNVEAWGPRFPDMTEPYDRSLRKRARTTALERGIQVHDGVYGAVLGPNAGTDAENRMMRTLGADVIGTSSVSEVIAARHMDISVLGLSLVAGCSFKAESSTPTGRDEPSSLESSLWDVLSGVIDRLETEEGT